MESKKNASKLGDSEKNLTRNYKKSSENVSLSSE